MGNSFSLAAFKILSLSGGRGGMLEGMEVPGGGE